MKNPIQGYVNFPTDPLVPIHKLTTIIVRGVKVSEYFKNTEIGGIARIHTLFSQTLQAISA